MIAQELWLLITLQIFMGAFDTIYHHEFTERLAWRSTQRHELQLHGVRNLFYALLFIGIGCFQFHGAFAWAVAGVLFAELLITLKDFVEEDLTRKLAPSERVTHTLLALNYGAILALLAPVLLDWSRQPSGIVATQYGLWTPFMLAAACGVALFGVRDLLAARRMASQATSAQLPSFPGQRSVRSVLITGGTGFVGQHLVRALVQSGARVTVLTRKLENVVQLGAPITIITDLAQLQDTDRFDVVINLAGQPIAGGLWTQKYRRKLLNSRLETTRNLVELMTRLEHKPACFISSSAIGIYGVSPDGVVDETTVITDDGSFAQTLCQSWEAEARKAEALGVRTVLLRTGIVLDPAGGSLGQMLFPFEYGLGGPFGDGRQWMSWITRDDLVRLVLHAISDDQITGPLNGVAPTPVTNKDFAKALGHALHRPALLAIPAFVLRKGLGALGQEIFLASQFVQPTKSLTTGFEFRSPDISSAFEHVFAGTFRQNESKRTMLKSADHPS